MSSNKKDFFRYLVIKRCPFDFGLGVGVIAADRVSFTDKRNRGWDSPIFEIEQRESARLLMEEHVTVLSEPVVKERQKLNPNPMKIPKRKIQNIAHLLPAKR